MVRPTSGTVLGTVLLLDARTQLSRAAERDLELAGFEVVSVTDGRGLLETARRHAPVAILLVGGVTGPSWRRWMRDPDLRRVPVVVLARGRPRQPPSPWPLGAFVRADAYVSAADLERRGAAADAVHAVIARGDRVPPPRRERLGEALWHVGSVLHVVGLLVALAGVVITVTSGAGGILWGMPLLGAGVALQDLGGRLGLGQRVGLQWQSWVLIAFALVAARALFGDP
jgi:hypothetical protein